MLQQPKDRFQEAYELLQHEDNVFALRRAIDAIAAVPSFERQPLAHNLLGRAYACLAALKHRDYTFEMSFAAHEQALRLSNRSIPDVFHTYAVSLNRAGENERAVALLAESLETFQDDVSAAMLAAQNHHLGQHERELELIDSSLNRSEFRGTHAYFWLMKAGALFDLDRVDEAKDALLNSYRLLRGEGVGETIADVSADFIDLLNDTLGARLQATFTEQGSKQLKGLFEDLKEDEAFSFDSDFDNRISQVLDVDWSKVTRDQVFTPEDFKARKLAMLRNRGVIGE